MKTLQQCRLEVNQLDKSIIRLLARRELLSAKIGFLKLQQKKKILDRVREKELKMHHTALAKSSGLEPLFIERLFKIIFARSKKIQAGARRD